VRSDDLGYDSLEFNGCLYAPLHRIEVAAGPFLPDSFDSIEHYLELPRESRFRHGVRDRYDSGYRLPRRGLGAAKVCGDSMVQHGVYDGQTVLFQSHDFESVENGRAVVIERIGEGENAGSWILKELRIERPRICIVNDLGDELDSDDPVLIIRSANSSIRPSELDPRGRYRIRGVILRSLWSEDFHLVDIHDVPFRKPVARASVPSPRPLTPAAPPRRLRQVRTGRF